MRKLILISLGIIIIISCVPKKVEEDCHTVIENYIQLAGEQTLSETDSITIPFSKKGYTLHCLRHTFASELIKRDVSSDIVSELLGHKHLGMTLSRYAKGFSIQQLYDAIITL